MEGIENVLKIPFSKPLAKSRGYSRNDMFLTIFYIEKKSNSLIK